MYYICYTPLWLPSAAGRDAAQASLRQEAGRCRSKVSRASVAIRRRGAASLRWSHTALLCGRACQSQRLLRLLRERAEPCRTAGSRQAAATARVPGVAGCSGRPLYPAPALSATGPGAADACPRAVLPAPAPGFGLLLLLLLLLRGLASTPEAESGRPQPIPQASGRRTDRSRLDAASGNRARVGSAQGIVSKRRKSLQKSLMPCRHMPSPMYL